MTIFKNSLLTLGLAVLAFSAVFVISVMIFMDSLYYEINMTSLGNTARSLMTVIGDEIDDVFLSHDGDHSVQISFPVDIDEAHRLTLINTSGYVLWDSHVTEGLVNHIDRKEVSAALEGREAGSRRDSISTGMRRIYHALPVFDDEHNVIGVFRLSFSIPGFGMRVSSIIVPFIIFISLFIAVAFWAVIMYSRSLSASLERLVSIAKVGVRFSARAAPLISGTEAEEPVAPEFLSLERAMRAMTEELNIRFENAKSEGSRLEAILNGMSEAVFAMDSSLKLHLVNPKARELFNLGDCDIKTASAGNAMTLLEATRSTELMEIAKKAINSGEPFETELTFHKGMSALAEKRAVAGQVLLVHASPLAPGGAVLVLQDISRLVKLERVRKDFVANVSHELRTPIQVIKGFSETLLDSVSDSKGKSAKYAHFIDIIYKNAGIMENLTNDLLILASLENDDSKTFDMEEQFVAPLIDEAVSSVEHQAKKKQIDIIPSCQDNIKAKLHGSFIIQALINLIDNGIKYSPVKSKLWVSTVLTNDMLIFEVRDKGIGIPSEHLERIFERFYRVDKARSREAGGTGLGLSIVRHIALLHNGNAEAESRIGEGSVFRIKIPV
ncbi:MAG: ATP-binding protein [Treponema sp.]|nr:ATP-binding protein [Treponema sp.]